MRVRSPATWPIEDNVRVFVETAIQRIGADLFPSQWTENELFEDPIGLETAETIKIFKRSRSDEQQRHDIILLAIFLDCGSEEMARIEQDTKDNVDDPVQSFISRYEADRDAARSRLSAVQTKLRKDLYKGRLTAERQNPETGAFTVMTREAWGTPDAPRWLFASEHCDVYKTLFIQRAGLEQSTNEVSLRADTEDIPRSEYLQFLLLAARRYHPGEADQMTAKELAAQIHDLAKEEGVQGMITDNLAKTMATILRSPEAGMGKAGRHNRINKRP